MASWFRSTQARQIDNPGEWGTPSALRRHEALFGRQFAILRSCACRDLCKRVEYRYRTAAGRFASANNTPLPESAAIMEYLEDKFPEPPLRPAGPEAKARVRLLQRIGELQIMTPLVELSRQADPAQRDPSASVWLTRLVRGLSSVQNYIGDDQFAAGAQLTLADCELAPALFMLAKIAAAYGKPGLLQAYPPIGRYLASSSRHPAIRRVLADMASAWALREPA